MAERYTVEVSGLAQKDIDAILIYLKNNYSENTAAKTYLEITEKIDSLAIMPTAHPIYQHGSANINDVVR